LCNVLGACGRLTAGAGKVAAGAQLDIIVTARNATGESQPTPAVTAALP